MKNSRLQKYLSTQTKPGTQPMKKRSDVKDSHDKHIDQDFPGYPANPAKEEVIKPKTSKEKKTASVDVKDGEKKISKNNKGTTKDEEDDGSGFAFLATEEVRE